MPLQVASAVDFVKRFVAAQESVSSSTWRSLAAAIRPFSESTKGGVVSLSERARGINAPSEVALAVLDAEMKRTLQQAELAASRTVNDQPSSKNASLSQLEVTLYSMLLSLAMLSMTCYRTSNTTYIEKTLMTIVWQLSLQFRDLLPEESDKEADEPCHSDKSLVALLARVVITSLYTGPSGVRHIELRGPSKGFHFPFDLLCSFESFHPSLQPAAAAEIGCKGKYTDILAQLDLARLLCVFTATWTTGSCVSVTVVTSDNHHGLLQWGYKC